MRCVVIMEGVALDVIASIGTTKGPTDCMRESAAFGPACVEGTYPFGFGA